tara:strand:- start:588 stop:1091 length:504 start_codon:yes stop_codon:yes gene_type:complete
MDYKALYEAQVEENKQLKEEVEKQEKKYKDLWSDFKNTRAEIEGVAVENIGLREEVEKLKEENQTYLKTTLKVLYEDLDCELTVGDLSHLYGNLRYETFNSNIKEDLTKFFKYYAEKLQDCETYWFDLNELKEEKELIKNYLAGSEEDRISRSTICDWYDWTEKDFE